MVLTSVPNLTEEELFLLTVPNDTEEAAWMVMPDYQWRVLELLTSILRLHVSRAKLPWYVMAELLVIMPRPYSSRTLEAAPDLLMAEADDHERTSWNVVEEGQSPAFVLEVVTTDSWTRDTEDKPPIYGALGVREYVIFAAKPKRGAPRLFGYRRDEHDQFVPWAPDESGALTSAALGGLTLYVEDGKWLRLRDAQGRSLPSAAEEAQRAEQEAQRAGRESRRAEREAQRAEREAQRAEREAAGRLVAERRAEEAEAEVARLRALAPRRDGQ